MRNLMMTMALIVVMAISLFFLAGSLLVRAQVNQMKGYWYDKVEVTVYLCGTTSTSGNARAIAVAVPAEPKCEAP